MEAEEIKKQLIGEIFAEWKRSEKLHGDMPDNMFEQIVIVNEEIGEVNKAVLHYHYESGSLDEIKKELIQSTAMCLKMLMKVVDLKHKQDES